MCSRPSGSALRREQTRQANISKVKMLQAARQSQITTVMGGEGRFLKTSEELGETKKSIEARRLSTLYTKGKKGQTQTYKGWVPTPEKRVVRPFVKR